MGCVVRWRAYQSLTAGSDPLRAVLRWTQVSEALARWRVERARAIRNARSYHELHVREERERGPIRPDQRMEHAASQLQPVQFDRMEPGTNVTWARRLLRFVWMLVDTTPLSASALEWAREWEWGKYVPGSSRDDLLLMICLAPDRATRTTTCGDRKGDV